MSRLRLLDPESLEDLVLDVASGDLVQGPDEEVLTTAGVPSGGKGERETPIGRAAQRQAVQMQRVAHDTGHEAEKAASRVVAIGCNESDVRVN